MSQCKHFKECEFVLRYVSRVKPHWDDFVSLYCHGNFQDVCKRLEWVNEHNEMPPPELMPTGRYVDGLLRDNQ